MAMMTRRGVLRGFSALALGGLALGGYAGAVEPAMRLDVTRWRPRITGWPEGLALRIAVLADIHIGPPWMTLARLGEIVARTNALRPDIVLLLGDYVAGHRFRTREVPDADVATVLAGLEAPLGVLAVLGNHDWWEDADAMARGTGPVAVGKALERVGIPVLENLAIRLPAEGGPVWIAGLGSQLAIPTGSGRFRGVDDLPGTLRQIGDDAPVVLMAHEPDIFPKVPERVALTISGHTHGGQVRIAGYSPIVPSRFGNRYAYGHVEEERRHLIVSGGLGVSGVPVRLGMPPEIVLVEPVADPRS